MAIDLGQLSTLFVAVISSGTLLQTINICLRRREAKITAIAQAQVAQAQAQAEAAKAEAAEIDTDVLESKFRTMLFSENKSLREDLEQAHVQLRDLRRQLLQAELTISDMAKQHQQEMAEVNARLKLAEERLTESERARAVLQQGPIL